MLHAYYVFKYILYNTQRLHIEVFTLKCHVWDYLKYSNSKQSKQQSESNNKCDKLDLLNLDEESVCVCVGGGCMCVCV